MSDRPTEFAYAHNPLRVMVETSPGSREFQTDPRARVEKLVLGSNEIQSQAIVQVFAGPIDTDPPGEEAALNPSEVLSGGNREDFGPFIGPDQEIRIYRDVLVPLESDKTILFSGYCRNPRYDERGGQPSNKSFTLVVRSMLETMSTEPECQVYGRWMRTADAQNDLDENQARDSEDPRGNKKSVHLVESLPCVFNLGGRPNRAASPIDAASAGEEQKLVHVFTADNDPDAKPWTFAQALRYLLHFHISEGKWWGSGNLFTSTNEFVADSAADRPEAPVSDDDAFKFAMLDEPRNLNCEGVNLPEALILLADSALIRFVLKTEPEEASEPANTLHFQARGCGPAKTISKQAVLNTQGLTAAEVLEQNTVKDVALQAVYEDVITRPVFLGDTYRYEATFELVPGWSPETGLDDVADVEAALEVAEAHWDLDGDELAADDWFSKYCKAGSDFHLHGDIGRRWVLNETGRYYEAGYARTTGPFVTAAYTPWGPSRALIRRKIKKDGEWADERIGAGEWSRNPRPFQQCFSADSHRRSMGIYVEFSFDGGVSWQPIPECRIMNLEEEAGIYLDADDLTTLVMPGHDLEDDEGNHYWKALLSNSARIRVTAVIDGDDRLKPELDAEAFNPAIAFATSKVFDVSARYKCNRRDAANSIFAPAYEGEGIPENPGGERELSCQTIEAVDDTERLQSMADGILDLLASRQNVAAVVIPWLTTDYQPLDCVSAIDGLGIELITHGPGRAARATDIVAVEYVGSYTRLIFEDGRMLLQREF